ncbi:low molecular weight protein-tyrosine-phosphatase [Pseudorhodoferax sp.]|uniref:low molecular weight protein-tyrosine-phosphatase n=1 Tax=Pseudorhodoferax sp. TaxID=1993553 RepID=UPI0039E30A3D
MYERILTVCTGNLCRSPLAEALLRLQLARDGRHDAQVRSAGLRAQPGKTVDDTMLFIARAQPALLRELEAHRAQPVNGTLLWWADLILVMEPGQAREVAKLDPMARGKVHLLGELTQARSIGDPYLRHESVYRETWQAVEAAVAAWRGPINQPG